MRARNEPAELYRHFDAEGNLLYVGVSFSAVERSKGHRDKPWWTLAVRMEVTPMPSRQDALDAEARAIKFENPKYNTMPGNVPLSPETTARLSAASLTSRNRAIVQARREGNTLREIAEVVGLTPPGVLKIINKENQQ